MPQKTSTLVQQEYMEYDKLKALIEYSPSNGMYEDLMAKESAVLETVNRVVDHSNKRELEAKEVMNMPVRQLVGRFGSSMKDMFLESFQVKEPKDVVTLFTKDTSRIIYMGAALVCLALFLYFVTISND
jgi:hypothetical protein